MNVVEQTIARLGSLNDLSERDGLILPLEYLNRSLANLDSPDTDEIVHLIADAISCMSREGQSSTLEFDAVNFAPQVSTQRHGQLAIEIKQEPLSFLLEEGFKVSSTTQHFCGPTCTVERRMAAYSHVGIRYEMFLS